jgi:hypothetical protein
MEAMDAVANRVEPASERGLGGDCLEQRVWRMVQEEYVLDLNGDVFNENEVLDFVTCVGVQLS